MLIVLCKETSLQISIKTFFYQYLERWLKTWFSGSEHLNVCIFPICILLEFFGRVFGLTSVSTFFNSIGISTNFRLFAMKIQWNNQFFKKKLQLQLNLLLTKLTWSRVKSLMIWKWEINSSKLHYDELYLPLTQAACILVLYPF